MAHRITIHPIARADLFDLYVYIADRSGPQRATDYIARIETLCTRLANFPRRGVARDDLGPDVRTLAMERRLLIVYRLGIDNVDILRVLYAGRDFGVDDLPASPS